MLTAFTRLFKTESRSERLFTWGDLVALIILAVLIFAGIRMAFRSPEVIQGPVISLDPANLPWYALLSLGRMTAAYFLSMLFTLIYGRMAAYNRRAEQVLMPLLDVLQSVPILSFLPVVMLSFSALLPENVAVELASIVLIFTSMAWNLTFAWYQSLTTLPKELREAGLTFRLNGWMRFRQLEFPFATISLVWNSVMSWAGGWFFLMAAEIFTVGKRDFRLPGLGAYLREAAAQSDFRAILWGVLTLVLVIVALDQLVWRPLLAWSDRFKVGLVGSEDQPTSWFYEAMQDSRLVGWFGDKLIGPVVEGLDGWMIAHFPPQDRAKPEGGRSWVGIVLGLILVLALSYSVLLMARMLLAVPTQEWGQVGFGLAATAARVYLALLIALAWTIPVGVLIGTNQRLAAILQPLVQITASVPATALFPVFLLFVLQLPAGLNLAAVLLMLFGTQWYLLFNIIAGANAIPQDLKYTATLMKLGRWGRWRTLILPALFPYLVTGAITASGGAWNASIVAEYVSFNGQTLHITGIGSLIAQATANGDYTLLLVATLAMIFIVILINRLLWRRLYNLAESNYRME